MLDKNPGEKREIDITTSKLVLDVLLAVQIVIQQKTTTDESASARDIISKIGKRPNLVQRYLLELWQKGYVKRFLKENVVKDVGKGMKNLKCLYIEVKPESMIQGKKVVYRLDYKKLTRVLCYELYSRFNEVPPHEEVLKMFDYLQQITERFFLDATTNKNPNIKNIRDLTEPYLAYCFLSKFNMGLTNDERWSIDVLISSYFINLAVFNGFQKKAVPFMIQPIPSEKRYVPSDLLKTP